MWESVDEIDWDSLPDKFAIKCNHGCKYNIICEDKSNLDIKKPKKLRVWMRGLLAQKGGGALQAYPKKNNLRKIS